MRGLRENESSMGDWEQLEEAVMKRHRQQVAFGVAVRGIEIKNAAKGLISCSNCSRGC